MKNGFVKKLITSVIVSITLLTILPISASAEWRQNSNGNWSYYDNGNLAKNTWFYDKSLRRSYHLDDNGIMQTGWIQNNGNWYYLNSDGSLAKDTTINGYKVDSDGVWVQKNINTTTNLPINEIIPITIPSNWKELIDNGYIMGNGSALVYKPKELNGYAYDKALWDMGSAIIQDTKNTNVHTTSQKYNGHPSMRYEYTNTDSTGKVKRNCFIVVVTDTKLYGFMLVGDDNYNFDLDKIDLEYVLNTSLIL